MVISFRQAKIRCQKTGSSSCTPHVNLSLCFWNLSTKSCNCYDCIVLIHLYRKSQRDKGLQKMSAVIRKKHSTQHTFPLRQSRNQKRTVCDTFRSRNRHCNGFTGSFLYFISVLHFHLLLLLLQNKILLIVVIVKKEVASNLFSFSYKSLKI